MNTSHEVLSGVLAKYLHYRLPSESCASASWPSYIVFKRRASSADRDASSSGIFLVCSCLLCDVHGIKREAMSHHFELPQHVQHRGKLKADLERVAMVSNRFCRLYSKPIVDEIAQIHQIGDGSARASVQVALFESLIAEPPEDEPDEDETDRNHSRKRLKEDEAAFETELGRVITKIKMIEQNDRLVLLALAVWKAQCLLSFVPATTATSSIDTNLYLAAQEWSRSGWKSCKNADSRASSSNAMTIIVNAVRPFLESAL